jgi:hypothetical protein
MSKLENFKSLLCKQCNHLSNDIANE